MTVKKFITTLASAALVVSCTIENDIPYPTVEGSVVSLEVEGQCGPDGSGAGQSSIDKVGRTVSLFVNDEVDIRNLRIKKLTVTNDAEILPEDVSLIDKDHFPRRGFAALDSLPSSADTRVDFSKPAKFVLRTYQDYSWTVSVSQVVRREILMENQIGKAVIDEVNHNVVVYVAKGQSLERIKVVSFKLGGPNGKVFPDPTAIDSFDFTSPYTFTVWNAWDEDPTEWTVYVYEKEGSVATTLNVSPMTSRAFLSGEIQSGKTPVIEYKKSTDASWETLQASALTLSGTDYSALIRGLEPETDYQCKVSVDGVEGGTKSFTTAPATPLQDGDFDNWNQEGKLWNPWPAGGMSFWDTGNRGAVTVSASNSVPTDDTCDGEGKAALLESKYLIIKFAAGNIFTGTYLKTVGTNGVLSFGREFSAFPTALRINYKYQSSPIDRVGSSDYSFLSGKPDSCHVYIALADWDAPLEIRTKPSERQILDKNDSKVIAYGEFVSSETTTSYKQLEIPLDYRSYRQPKYIVVVASSSKYGDFFTGGTGSRMWVDDFELLYE